MIDDLLRDGDLRAVAASLRPDAAELDGVDRGRAELDAAIARAAWSVLAEPGDGVAGALIAEFGAVDALRSALDERWHGLVSLDSETARAARALTDARNRWRPRASLRAVRDALDGARDVGATLLVPGDDCWPTSLDDLGANAPSALWVRGDVGLLAPAPHIAIVGARASSSYGDLIAAELSGDLADSGTVIVSGGEYFLLPSSCCWKHLAMVSYSREQGAENMTKVVVDVGEASLERRRSPAVDPIRVGPMQYPSGGVFLTRGRTRCC